MNTTTPVLLLTGYLGSGKTTLLNRILTNERGIRFAVIVNDIGEVNIDASLIKKGGIVGQNDNQDNPDLVALQNGCICCSLKMDLVEQISGLIASGDFDYIVIEASGICEPAPIAQTICSIPLMDEKYTAGGVPRLDCIVTVVDALRLRDEFENGDRLARHKKGEEDIESLVIDQIEFCNIILLNKISEVSAREAAKVKAVVRAIQPKAEIIETDYCDVELDKILNTNMFRFDEVATSARWIEELERPADDHEHEHEHHHEHEHEHEHHHDHEHEHQHQHHHEHEHDHDHEHCDDPHCSCHHHHHHEHGGEYGIETFVYFRRPGFDLNKFDRFVATQWPAGIIRTKGLLYFASNTDMSYIFEQAGSQKKLSEAGLWYATAPENELEELMAADPAIGRDWDATYGDRMIKLVFIGQNIDRQEIEANLDKCLDTSTCRKS